MVLRSFYLAVAVVASSYCCLPVSARLGRTNFTVFDHVKPKRRRSLQELSNNVFEELRVLQESEGPHMAFALPQVVHKVHQIVVEGSAAEGEDFDAGARHRALQALTDGGDRMIRSLLLTHGHDNATTTISHLRSSAGDHRHRQLPAKKGSSNWESNKAGIAGFTSIMIFFSVLLISNIVAGSTGSKPWPFLGNDNAYFQGTPGKSFQNISPCSKLPMQSDALWSYFPVTQGLMGNLKASVGKTGADEAVSSEAASNDKGVLRMFELIMNPEAVADEKDFPNEANCIQNNQACLLTAECCRKKGYLVNCSPETQRCEEVKLAEAVGGGSKDMAIEPFCLAFTRTTEKSLVPDSLAFSPRSPWPPMDLTWGAQGLVSEENCAFHSGWPIADIPVFKIIVKLTIQFDGIALSWADNAKLSFGSNAATSGDKVMIWDGFRNQPLPEVPDINFWIRMRFHLVELKGWKAEKEACESAGWAEALGEFFSNRKEQTKKDPAAFGEFLRDTAKNTPLTLSVIFDVELYVGVNKKTASVEDGEAFGATLAQELSAPDGEEVKRRLLENFGGNNEENKHLSGSDGAQLWRRVQETTTREDPCIILTMPKAALKIPLFGDLIFAKSIGGFCNFPAEETGVFCTPSGFFFNIENQFKIEGGLGGILSRMLDQAQNNGVVPPLEKSGNSIGVFQNPDGRTEAVVFRLEFPVNSLFGVPIGGGARPVIHFQYVKGSEVERRRQTLLRSRPIPEAGGQQRPWVANCVNVMLRCQTWSKFVMYGDNENEYEICSDILVNPEQHPDKLLYYNRVLTADPTDPKLKYKITPGEGTSYHTPAKYDFRSNEDADVFILYLALKDFGNIVILVKEVSVSLILSDGPPPTKPEDVADDFRAAQEAYEALSEDMKEIFSPPSLFNFPGLEEYMDYIEHGPDEVLSDGKLLQVQEFDKITDENKSDNLAMFLRVFCKVSVLFFISISIGLIVENFADGVNPNLYAVAGQFELDTVGFRWSVAVSTELEFDRRRHLHLEGEDYHRALASSGLEGAGWNVDVSMGCVPGSLCEGIVQFFEDVGEAIWDGMQAIGKFFAEDVVEFFNDAIAAVGEWGKRLMDSIKEFGQNVVNNIKNVFENGEVAKMLDSERLDAFGADAHNAIKGLTDGKITLNDLRNVGKAVLDGAKIAVDFIVAGITDIINAIGSFFGDLGDFFRKGWGRQDWVEFRTKSSFTNIHWCKAACDRAAAGGNQREIKRNCWCMDELECPVKVSQRRKCRKHCGFWICGRDKCDSWRDVEIERKGGFPRFDGRVFDEGCRLERAAKLAEAEEHHSHMVKTSDLVDRNMQRSFAGLQNFSPSARNRRRLSEVKLTTQVKSLEVPPFRAVKEGGFGPTHFEARYQGAQLKAESLDVDQIEASFEREIDFSDFKRAPGKPEPVADDSLMVREARLGAVNQYLGALEMDDPIWQEKQPTLLPPKAKLAWGSPGSSPQDPIVFDCVGSLAEAWKAKLEGSEPETLRRTRRRRLGGHAELTVVELVLIGVLRQKIRAEEVKLDIEYGEFVGDDTNVDVFARARELIGEDGVGSFMNPEHIHHRRFLRALNGVSIDDFTLDIRVESAEPRCDSIRWTFNLVVLDHSDRRSETLLLYAVLPYGFSELETSPVEDIQTVCDTDPYSADDLDDDFILKEIYNVSTFTPRLRNNNCRSPFAELSSFDKVMREGMPCTTNYRLIHRKWLLTDPSCQMQDAVAYQKITLGGLEIEETGEPDTPILNLLDRNISLANERNPSVLLTASDFFSDEDPPRSMCGICDGPEIPSIFISSPIEPLGCEDIGFVHEVSITALNRIGITATETVVVRIVDDVPPNLVTKTHSIALNKFGWADEAVEADDIDNGSWDNCGVVDLRVSPHPNFGCGHEGIQTVILTGEDASGNQITKQQEIVVTDDRHGIGLHRGEHENAANPGGSSRRLTESHGTTRPRANGPGGGRGLTEKRDPSWPFDRPRVVGQRANDPIFQGRSDPVLRPMPESGSSGNYLSLPQQTPSEIDVLIDIAMLNDFEYSKCEEIALYIRPSGQDHFMRLHHFISDPTAEWSIPAMYNQSNPDSVVFYEAVCLGVSVEEQLEGQECRAEVKAEVLCEDTGKVLRETCYRAEIRYDSDAAETFHSPSDLPGYLPTSSRMLDEDSDEEEIYLIEYGDGEFDEEDLAIP